MSAAPIEECPICLVGLGGKNETDLLLACGHVFHRDCLLATLVDAPLTEWRCPTCRTALIIGLVTRASALGSAAAGRHFCVVREPATPAAQQRAGGWHGMPAFLRAMEPLDVESQKPLQQKQSSWACSTGALLHMICPPAGRALLSEAARVHVRRLLDPSQPTIVQAAVERIAAVAALLLFLAAGCALLQLAMLAGAAAICRLLGCLSAYGFAQLQQCYAVPQPAWALLLIWGAAGAVSWQEAKRRGFVAPPWTLRLDRQLAVIMATWAAATMALACVLLLLRLSVDLMVAVAPALVDTRSKPFDGPLLAGGSANY